MKKFNVSVPREYEKDGQTKKFWNNVGKITLFEATEGKEVGLKLELFMFPDTPFYVFADKPKNASNSQAEPKTVNTTSDTISDGLSTNTAPNKVDVDIIEYPTEEINPEDIPF